jgi:hypothetical protein
MNEDQDQRQQNSDLSPEVRAVSGNPDVPPRQPDHDPEKDRELLRPDEDEEAVSGKPARDGEGGSDQPGTTLPGYG